MGRSSKQSFWESPLKAANATSKYIHNNNLDTGCEEKDTKRGWGTHVDGESRGDPSRHNGRVKIEGHRVCDVLRAEGAAGAKARRQKNHLVKTQRGSVWLTLASLGREAGSTSHQIGRSGCEFRFCHSAAV